MSKHVEVGKPFKTIHIADPSIVDVVVVSDRTAIFVPKNSGSTNVDFLAESPDLIATVNVDVAYSLPTRIKLFIGVDNVQSFACGTRCDRVKEQPTNQPSDTH
jgi:hypothetical protein